MKLYLPVIENPLSSVHWDGVYLGKELGAFLEVVVIEPRELSRIKGGVIFFPDRHLFLDSIESIHESNRVVTTWWHGWNGSRMNVSVNPVADFRRVLRRFIPPAGRFLERHFPMAGCSRWETRTRIGDQAGEEIRRKVQRASRVVVSCTEVRDRVKGWLGLAPDSLVVIPIGVDSGVFFPLEDRGKRGLLRKSMGLPERSLLIPNLMRDTQVDGSPKYEKAPEVFCDVVKRLSSRYEVHVVLANQRRGFITRRLREMGIPFTHFPDLPFNRIPDLYRISDISLITSREEGGPKQLLESMACGIPIVSTRQGMALDLLEDGENGFLADVDDVAGLTGKLEILLGDSDLRRRFVARNLGLSRKYDWRMIAREYQEKIFGPIARERA